MAEPGDKAGDPGRVRNARQGRLRRLPQHLPQEAAVSGGAGAHRSAAACGQPRPLRGRRSPGRQADAPAQQGELIFNIGGCTNCHTAKGGQLLAGGDPLRTPFGSFYPPTSPPTPRPASAAGARPTSPAPCARARPRTAPPFYPVLPLHLLHPPDRRGPPGAQGLSRHRPAGAPAVEAARARLPLQPALGPACLAAAPSSSPAASSPTPPRTPPGTAAPTSWRGRATARSATRRATFARRAAGGPRLRRRSRSSDATGKKTDPNITQDPDVGLGKWSESDIVTVLTLGMTPDGDFVGARDGEGGDNATGKLPPEDVRRSPPT